MGNASAVAAPVATKKNDGTTVEQLLDYVLPIYYTKIPLIPECKEKLKFGWWKIRHNKAEGFYRLKQEHPEAAPCPNPMEFFANRLMIRFYEVHPVSRAMFTKSTRKQGTLVMNSLTLLVKEMDNKEAFDKHLKMIAMAHAKMGVRATEFGIFGEVLFWTLRLVLGPEDYDVITHTAWIKFYSRILDVVVPILLKSEMEKKEETKELNVKRMMPIMDTTSLVFDGAKDDTMSVRSQESTLSGSVYCPYVDPAVLMEKL